MSELEVRRVRKAGPADVKRLAALIADGFHEDPLFGWVLPEADRRRQRLPVFCESVIRVYLPRGEVYITDDGVAGAVWAPPDMWRAGMIDQLRIAAMFIRVFGRRAPRTMGMFDAIDKRHPHDPHYYLLMLATDRGHHGQGIGGQVLQPVLSRCDATEVPAYLESSNPRNLSFYERQGFRVMEEIHLPDGAPLAWGMWREPRPSGRSR